MYETLVMRDWTCHGVEWLSGGVAVVHVTSCYAYQRYGSWYACVWGGGVGGAVYVVVCPDILYALIVHYVDVHRAFIPSCNHLQTVDSHCPDKPVIYVTNVHSLDINFKLRFHVYEHT